MWNGMLSPTFGFKKEIGEVLFIPLQDMTAEDWEWLDFKNLRPEAKNRIAEVLISGELIGFFDVRILEKAKAKPRYLWPATKKEKQKLTNSGDDEGDSNPAPFFRYEKGDGLESDEFFDYDDLVAQLSYRGASWAKMFMRWAVRAGTVAVMSDDEDSKELEELAKSIGDRVTSDEDIDLLFLMFLAWLARMIKKLKSEGRLDNARELQDLLDSLMSEYEGLTDDQGV